MYSSGSTQSKMNDMIRTVQNKFDSKIIILNQTLPNIVTMLPNLYSYSSVICLSGINHSHSFSHTLLYLTRENFMGNDPAVVHI